MNFIIIAPSINSTIAFQGGEAKNVSIKVNLITY